MALLEMQHEACTPYLNLIRINSGDVYTTVGQENHNVDHQAAQWWYKNFLTNETQNKFIHTGE